MADGLKKSANDIDQIRNLIFGEEIELIRKEFDSIQKQIEKMNKIISENMQMHEQNLSDFKNQSFNTHESIQGTIENLSSEIDVKIEKLRGEILSQLRNLSAEKTNKNQLADFFIEIGNRIKEDANGTNQQ